MMLARLGNIMQASEQPTQAKDEKRRCDKCGSRELRRQPRFATDLILSIQPYQCGRCAHRQRRFRFGWGLAVRVFWLAAVLSAGTYFWINPPTNPFRAKDVAQSETESLARARTAMGGQLSTFEQMMTKKPKSTLDNATVLKLWHANVGANVILQMIRTSNADFDVSAGAIIELREAQVDQAIILAMIDASYTNR
jgi:hypothetical protein